MFIILNILLKVLILDAPMPWAMSLQDIGSPIGEGLSEFHNVVIFYIIIVLVGVIWIIFGSITFIGNKFSYKLLTHGTVLELVWTITPALVLVVIAYPSFKLLYLIDENVNALLTVKVVGKQWYWSVEYSDIIMNKNYDIYIESEWVDGSPRLLAVDNNIVLPIETNINFIVTGADVIHDMAVPSLGIKVDAIPGRLNQVGTYIIREGLYYGQCSELCGTGHGFMPICVEGVSIDKYLNWLYLN